MEACVTPGSQPFLRGNARLRQTRVTTGDYFPSSLASRVHYLVHSKQRLPTQAGVQA